MDMEMMLESVMGVVGVVRVVGVVCPVARLVCRRRRIWDWFAFYGSSNPPSLL